MALNKKPLSLSQLKKLHPSIVSANVLHNKRLTPVERLAVWITQAVGSMGFFFMIFGWTVIWLAWNMFAPFDLRFDPFPAFVLWLFISNMIQIFLMPLIMVGQNLQGRHAEVRAESDFEINMKAEKEVENILLHLENQNTMMLEILHRLDRQEKVEEKILQKSEKVSDEKPVEMEV